MILAFVVTTECNLACRHCLRDFAGARHLSFELVEKAVAGAKKFGLESIHVTGGEPFLYKDIGRLFELASVDNIPLSFSSNGLLLSKNADLLKKYKHLIKLINISLESASEEIDETIRGKGHFQAVLGAFEFCRTHQIPFGLLSCLGKTNTQNLPELIKLARKQKAACISFNTVLPCTRAKMNDLVLSEAERANVYEELKGLVNTSSWDVFNLLHVPVLIREPIFASKNIVMCTNQMLRWVTVDVDGSIHFCCFLTVYDVPKDVEKRLRVASLADVSFDEGLERFSKALHDFHLGRIKDYQNATKKDTFDFNSCFYCCRKLGIDNAPDPSQ